VEYTAKDSLRFDIKDQKVYLFREADIKYENIDLKSGYVEIDFPKKLVNATFIRDSAGKEIQVPEFTQGSQKFKSKVMSYNYDTKRGYIQNVFHKAGRRIPAWNDRQEDGERLIYLKDGWYTTCDLEDNPHYEFKFGRPR